jgi:hypothetical protein
VTSTRQSATSSATPTRKTTRRTFCCSAASLLLVGPAFGAESAAIAQPPPSPPGTPTRPNVAAIDHDRVIAAATRYLTQSATPLTSLPCPFSPGTVHDYYSEADPRPDAEPTEPPFTTHRDAVFQLGLAVPALAAAYFLTADERYAEHAVLHLRAWFVDPATRMTPSLEYGQVVPAAPSDHPTLQNNSIHAVTGRFQGILETLPLVEIAQAIPFLSASSAFKPADLSAVRAWFAAYLDWLTAPEDSGPRLPALARDQKDHHGTSWLLQASAYSSLATPQGDVAKAENSALGKLRHLYKTVTLRAQISALGTFPHELGSSTPYRDSLFNLDMMAGICQLLSTRFESIWNYQLEDGPGMRAAIAYHFPFIASRSTWPFRADAQHFNELPSRRATLLFAARAYERPEYATLWKSLPPDPTAPDILRTIPIHQPLLWVRTPPPAAS